MVSCLVLILLLHIPLIISHGEDITIDDHARFRTNDKRPNVPFIESSSRYIYFEEQFQDERNWLRWIKSQAKNNMPNINLFRYEGEWAFEIPESSVYKNDYGLILKSKAKHYAISAHLNKPYDFSTNLFIVQYDVKFQTNQQCGGAYIKLLSHDENHLDLSQMTDKTPYTILFGPDMCRFEYKYLLKIVFRHPKTGLYSEYHAKQTNDALDTYFTDKKSHLYKLVITDQNYFQMYIDNQLINSGNILTDMEPSISPLKHQFHKSDSKFDHAFEYKKSVDVRSTESDGDWCEMKCSQTICDNAIRSNDWFVHELLTKVDLDTIQSDHRNNEQKITIIETTMCQNTVSDGNLVSLNTINSVDKNSGLWQSNDKSLDGKQYEADKRSNSDYFELTTPFKLTPIHSVALELWSMVDGVVFDNFLLTSDQSIAEEYAKQLWNAKFILERKPVRVTNSSISKTQSRITLWIIGLLVLLLCVTIILITICLFQSTTEMTNNERLTANNKNDEWIDNDNTDKTQLDKKEHSWKSMLKKGHRRKRKN